MTKTSSNPVKLQKTGKIFPFHSHLNFICKSKKVTTFAGNRPLLLVVTTLLQRCSRATIDITAKKTHPLSSTQSDIEYLINGSLKTGLPMFVTFMNLLICRFISKSNVFPGRKRVGWVAKQCALPRERPNSVWKKIPSMKKMIHHLPVFSLFNRPKQAGLSCLGQHHRIYVFSIIIVRGGDVNIWPFIDMLIVFNQFVINDVFNHRQKRKPVSTARAARPAKKKATLHLTDTSSEEENIRRPPLRQRKNRLV